VQCTLIAIRYSDYLKTYYWRLKTKKGSGKAIIATARKLLGIIYDTLKNNWIFEDFPNFVLNLPDGSSGNTFEWVLGENYHRSGDSLSLRARISGKDSFVSGMTQNNSIMTLCRSIMALSYLTMAYSHSVIQIVVQ
jgi:hypothetical protein